MKLRMVIEGDAGRSSRSIARISHRVNIERSARDGGAPIRHPAEQAGMPYRQPARRMSEAEIRIPKGSNGFGMKRRQQVRAGVDLPDVALAYGPGGQGSVHGAGGDRESGAAGGTPPTAKPAASLGGHRDPR